ncbi:hypothetical protein A6U87_26375 [Rhizobium sp. AC44/96]|jgi:hypothetical protein|uniref:hypothetical protein n=1 Tax=unclassified Rhizobium TaxID=2613769 RepID=UPI00080F9DD2|nr:MULTISPECIES: hypothetical protein [unclassified Rhizobium]MDM9619580.1 hypothetical protein [Rhizobium sp. S96]OCJ14025.1 hypothetical protein A6U87_26375 [Rhizobium sp. AC44/96]
MSQDTHGRKIALSHHILPTSGTMIGICMTLIGLVKVTELKGQSSHVDEYAALATLVFLASAMSSYLSLRMEDNVVASRRLELFADQCFLLGLVAIVGIGVLFAYSVI